MTIQDKVSAEREDKYMIKIFSKLTTFIMWLVIVILALVIVGAGLLFWYKFISDFKSYPDKHYMDYVVSGLSNTMEEWGQFGDYFGGVTNPIIGLITVILVLKTIRQQGIALAHSEESLRTANEVLKETRNEIQIGREIQAGTEAALKEQILEARKQNNFANYYKHVEEFSKYIEKSGSPAEDAFANLNARTLHHALFPSGFSEGKLEINNSIKLVYVECLLEVTRFFYTHAEFNESMLEKFIVLVGDKRAGLYTFFNINGETLFHQGLEDHKVTVSAMYYHCPQNSPKLLFDVFLKELHALFYVYMFETKFDNGSILELLNLLNRLQNYFPEQNFYLAMSPSHEKTPFWLEEQNLQVSMEKCAVLVDSLKEKK